MKRLLLASHGPLARAMKSTLELFTGPEERVSALCAYVDDDSMDVEALIDRWASARVEGDEWIVVTDIFGGSINNAFMQRLGDSSIRLIAGMSLPLAIELVAQLDAIDDAGLSSLVARVGAEGTRLCSMPVDCNDDEDF